MTTEPNKPENQDIDELTSNWLDSDAPESNAKPGHISESLSDEQLRQAADLQLVHSMLLQSADTDEDAKERQIQNVLKNVDNASEAPSKTRKTIFHHHFRPLIRYAVAAVLIISVTLIITKMPTNTAVAALDKMIDAIDNAADRTYLITVAGDRERRRPPKNRRNSYERPYQDRRAGLDGATLYLRGTDQFVLFRQTHKGKSLINGSDGQTRWMIRPDKPVLVSKDPEAFRIPMPKDLAAILTLDFKATLEHIRDHYKVKFLEEINDDQNADSSLKYLDAQKKNRDFPGPKNIEILADTKTGVLQQIEFAGIHLQGDPTPKRLIIELKNQDPLPPDWFTRQAHHPEDAQIDFISE